MALIQEAVNEITIAIPKQRVDSANARQFEQDLLDVIKNKAKKVLVDFRDIDYISSAGLRVILLSAKTAKATGVPFALCSMKDKIKEVFVVSGFAKILSIHPSREIAIQAMSSN
ncbi:anti-sigma B factor antagonist [Azospirillaceae bacterium]